MGAERGVDPGVRETTAQRPDGSGAWSRPGNRFRVVAAERELGPVGTKVVFEDDRVRVWVLRLAPGERSAVHRHDLDHLLIQIRGDRIAVAPEPDAGGPHRDYLEAEVIPGMVAYVPKGGIETAINVGAESYYEVLVELKE
jgi:hypothetical protein